MKSMPPPLSAIVTPRVEAGSHMGNISRLGVPKYFSPAFLPPLMKPLDSPPRKVRQKIAEIRRSIYGSVFFIDEMWLFKLLNMRAFSRESKK